MELTKEIKEILENVVYWETCPKDYKDKINAYLKSVKESEALSIHDVSYSVAQQYAEFCVRCDREKLPLIKIDDYLKQL